MDIEDLPRDELAAALRLWARGYYAIEAAVELLVRHGVWLHRKDFRDAAVNGLDDTYGPPLAYADWAAATAALDAGRLPCTGSEAGMLRIMCSLAERIPVHLGDALTGLDDRNRALVSAAVQHAGGDRTAWNDR